MSLNYDNSCLRELASIKLQKLFHIFSVKSISKELNEMMCTKEHCEKENTPFHCWPSNSLKNLITCVASVKFESDKGTKVLQIQVPKLIHKLCSYLELHLNVVGLFRISGSHKRIAIIKERLKNGVELTDENPHDVANIFSQLFRQFKTHLIPQCMNFFIDQTIQMEKEERKLATQLCCLLLPSCHLDTLTYILHFFRKVVTHSESNKMQSSSLAAVFTPNLCEMNSSELGKTRSMIIKQQEFVAYLIDNCQIIGVVPSCLRDVVCPAGKCSHKNRSTESSTYHNSAVHFSGRKSLTGRLMSSVRKKKSGSSMSRGSQAKKKRGHSDSSREGEALEERPAKRRSLQGAADAIDPTPIKTSAPMVKPLQTAASKNKQERHDSRSATCFSSSAKPVHEQTFHIGTSDRTNIKETTRTSRRNLAKTFAFSADASKTKRHTFFKKIAGSLKSPAVRRKSIKRRAKRMESKTASEHRQKNVDGSHISKKEVVDVANLEGIRINDSVTIFEIDDTSLMKTEIENSPKWPEPPSPIVSSSDITRIYDSFDCLKEGEAHPLDPSTLNLPSPPANSPSHKVSVPPSPIGAPSQAIGFRSFDILNEAESVEILDSSQKQEEIFETMLDAQLDDANDGLLNREKSGFNPSPTTSSSRKPIIESVETHHSVKISPINSEKDLFSVNDIGDACQIVVDNVVEQVCDRVISVPGAKEMHLSILQTSLQNRVKPEPPIRTTSRKYLPFHAAAYSSVEELHSEGAEENCVKMDYYETNYRARCLKFALKPADAKSKAINKNSELVGKRLEDSDKISTGLEEISRMPNLRSKSTGKPNETFCRSTDKSPQTSDNRTRMKTLSENSRVILGSRFGKTPPCLVSGKVSAHVKHYNDLQNAQQTSVKKLAPLPYRDLGRKGSFKMGRPTGSQLKLDLPTQLELPPNANTFCPMPALKMSLHPTPGNLHRSRRRRSKSLESIADEAKVFQFNNLPRSPSVPTVAGRLPLTPLRQPVWRSQKFDFLDSSPAKRATPKQPRSRSPMLPVTDLHTML